MNEPSIEIHPPMQRPRIRNNPVILRECIALLRKKSAFLYLLAFLSFISLVFILILPHLLNTYSLYQYSNVRSRKIIVLLEVFQGILILILTPLFSSTSVNTEYERKTWDLLISTPINVSSILLGKYFSSILYVLLLMSSLIPVYSLTMTLGGVSPQEILFIFCIMLELAVTTGAIGLYCSIRWKLTVQSVSFTYLFMSLLYFVPPALIMMNFSPNNQPLGPFIFCSPLMIWLRYIDQTNLYPCSIQIALTYHFAFAALILIVLLRLCLREFSSHAPKSYKTAKIPSYPIWKIFSRPITALFRTLNRFFLRSPSPFVQKEIKEFTGETDSRLIKTQWWILAGSLLLAFACFAGENKEPFDNYVGLILYTGTLLVPCLVLPFGSNSIRSEIDRETWNTLVSTTLKPAAIVRSKFRACMNLFLCRFSVFLLFQVVIAALVILTRIYSIALFTFNRYAPGSDVHNENAATLMQHGLALLFFPVLFYVSARYFTAQSLYVSTYSKKTSSAYAVSFLAAVLLLLAPSTALFFLEQLGLSGRELLGILHPFFAVLSPFHALVFLSTNSHGFEPKFAIQSILQNYRTLPLFAQIVLFGALTSVLKALAIRRIKKYTSFQ